MLVCCLCWGRLLVKYLVLALAALVLRHDFLHDLDDSHIIESLGYFHEAALVFACGSVVVFTDFGHHDLRIDSRESALLVIENFLIEFFAVAKSGEFDFDIPRT